MRSLHLAVFSLALASTAAAQNYTIQTFAGGVLPENMPGISASLGGISGVAVDPAGNVLISLSDYNIVVRLDAATGNLTRVAGNGTKGYAGDNGQAIQAELSGPAGIAMDAAGNIYIADANNARIRMVSNGVITTVAGNGRQGYSGDNGAATSAQLNGPNDVALDKAGNLYIADFYNQAIRMVSGGVITTAAGNGSYGYTGDNGPAVQAQLGGPLAVAVDATGNLYIAEGYNNTVRRVTNGVISTIAGRGVAGYTGDGGPAARAALHLPTGLSVSAAGNLYVADYGNNRIRMISLPGGGITTVAGNGAATCSGDNAAAVRAGLGAPQRVAADASGNIYIVDSGRIRKVSRGLITSMISTIAGGGSVTGENGPALNAQLLSPQGLALDSAGNLFISDLGTGRVLKVAGGSITRVAGTLGQGSVADNIAATKFQLTAPSGLAIDAAGNLYIADTARVRKVSGGTIATVAGGGTAFGDNGPATKALLSNPQGLAVDSSGKLYLADLNRVRAVANGSITTFAGNGGDGYQGDNGPATAAMFSSPNGVAVDVSGNLLIADTVNNRVRMVANGTITTVAGNGANDFTGNNGTATSAAIALPSGVAADTAGNFYITDARRILKVTKGKLTTIGAIAGAQGIAVDADGNVYVADPSSHQVRILSPAGTTCAVTAPAPPVAPAAGGPILVNVKTGPACSWAVETLPAWISVSGDPFGAGPATATLVLPPNSDAPRSATIIIGGTNVTVAQAGNMTIVGQVTMAGAPLPGVNLALSGGKTDTATSDSGGFFSFAALDSTASYTVTPALSGYGFAPASQTFTNATANPTANFAATPQP